MDTKPLVDALTAIAAMDVLEREGDEPSTEVMRRMATTALCRSGYLKNADGTYVYTLVFLANKGQSDEGKVRLQTVVAHCEVQAIAWGKREQKWATFQYVKSIELN